MKQNKILITSILWVCWCLLPSLSQADYSIDAYVIGSGGGFSSTVGEPVVGQSTGGSYTNCTGFWCVAQALDGSTWVSFLPGLNLFGYPVDVPVAPPFTALELLAEVAQEAEQGKVMKYASGSFKVASTGKVEDFNLEDGEGYYVYVEQPRSLPFSGVLTCPAPQINLAVGLNLLTFPCAPAGYTSNDLFAAINGDVKSIQRFNKRTGKFETMADDGTGSPTGVTFALRRGEAYLVHMISDKTVVAP